MIHNVLIWIVFSIDNGQDMEWLYVVHWLLKDQSLIMGRGLQNGRGGHVKIYPYRRRGGGQAETNLAMLTRGIGGQKRFCINSTVTESHSEPFFHDYLAVTSFSTLRITKIRFY